MCLSAAVLSLTYVRICSLLSSCMFSPATCSMPLYPLILWRVSKALLHLQLHASIVLHSNINTYAQVDTHTHTLHQCTTINGLTLHKMCILISVLISHSGYSVFFHCEGPTNLQNKPESNLFVFVIDYPCT